VGPRAGFDDIYIYKNVTVRLCVCEIVCLCTNGTQKHVNLRTLFTDGVAIWIQRRRRIRACSDITYIDIYIYIDSKNMLLRPRDGAGCQGNAST
jgi:hypothetical protein